MAKKSAARSKEIESLTRANAKLKAENSLLKTQIGNQQHAFGKGWRMALIGFCVAAATACLIVGNILFWAGDTIINTDKYSETMTAVIKDPEVQAGVAHYATVTLFGNVDVDQVIQDALPPRAAFLAPTLTAQIRHGTEGTLQRFLANEKFQQTWVKVNAGAHERLIDAIKNSKSDGTINLQDVYAQLSQRLADTRLSFLANKTLPSNVGSIQVVNAGWLPEARAIINNIGWLKPVTLLLVAGFGAVAIWLSRNRRKLVIILSSFFSLGMLASLVGYRILQSLVVSRTDQVYQAAVDHASSIVLQPLVGQTRTLLAVSLLILLIAWLTGPYTAALKVRERLQVLLSGRLHEALLGRRESGFTRWIGAHKRLLEWLVVAGVGVIMLFVKLSPKLVVSYAILVLVLVLIIEILAAPPSTKQR